jgi:hypothetical protein
VGGSVGIQVGASVRPWSIIAYGSPFGCVCVLCMGREARDDAGLGGRPASAVSGWGEGRADTTVYTMLLLACWLSAARAAVIMKGALHGCSARALFS